MTFDEYNNKLKNKYFKIPNKNNGVLYRLGEYYECDAVYIHWRNVYNGGLESTKYILQDVLYNFETGKWVIDVVYDRKRKLKQLLG